MKKILRLVAWVACMAPGAAMADGLAQARQQQGTALAQHLGSGWSFDVGSCQLINTSGAGHNLTLIPMDQVSSPFSSDGAVVSCRSAGAKCITRKMDGRVVSNSAKMTLVPGATWESTHAANIAERVRALCQLPANASAAQLQNTTALNNTSVAAYILARREIVFASLRPRIHDMMRFTVSSCVIEEPRSGGAVATIPVRSMAMRPNTQHAQGITFHLQCSRNQPCITIRQGPTPTASSLSWQLKGSPAQQAAVTPAFIELKRLCTLDHELPPVIN